MEGRKSKFEVYVPPKRREAVQSMSAPPQSRNESSSTPQSQSQSQSQPKSQSQASAGAPISAAEASRRRRSKQRKPRQDIGPSQKPTNDQKAEFVPQARPVSSSSSASPRHKGKQRNTESFDPSFEKPDLRVAYGSPAKTTYSRPVGVHDVIVVPEMFCSEDDGSVYQNLLKELEETKCDSLFVEWHGDSHVIAGTACCHSATAFTAIR